MNGWTHDWPSDASGVGSVGLIVLLVILCMLLDYRSSHTS
jgi:hypothetical protein